MGNRKFHLRYGREAVSFDIPEKQVLYELQGSNRAPLPDLAKAYREALARPMDSPPLREIVRPGEKVVVSVSDITRAWQRNDRILPILLETLNEAGVPDENITIVIVVGAHRLNTEPEFVELCGEKICRCVRVVNHDCWDEKNMVYLGRTSRGTEVSVNRMAVEADRLILTGGVIYHYMAGYGGGRKSILPGLSSIKTIRQNHLWGLGPDLGSGSNPRAASGKTRGNELHEDMMEIAGFVKPDFIVNTVPNLDGEIAAVFAGNWVSAWAEGTKLVDEIFGVGIEEEADVVIATAGGYPRDINLYQTGKTMDNAYYAMKKGGAAVILAECPDITEPREFFQWLEYPSAFELEKALRESFTIAGWVALKEVECNNRGPFIIVTRPENFQFLRQTPFITVATIEEGLRAAYEKCGAANPKVTVMPQGANTLPIKGRKS
ncbi:MAG TPA: nickel-dependent lactate racemase [Thermodesulfobacteriota bacterium]|nr:nickel-dependent lactate racemase [Thermodesulfobacteriota bacterium]